MNAAFDMSQIDVQALRGVTQDSRAVKAGYLFAALPGSKSDGRNFIETAIHNGARVILAPTGTMLPETARVDDVQIVTHDHPRHVFAKIAAAFYARQPEHIVAVTGTNGKTSVVHFVAQLWKARGHKAVSYGTLGVHGEGISRPGGMTTPETEKLQADLADLAAAGITHLALEASSHGLDQRRLDGVQMQAAAFTNLSHDHMDYHDGVEHYRDAKARLFSLLQNGVAVLNADSTHFDVMSARASNAGNEIISYGFKAQHLKIVEITPTSHGQHTSLEIFGKPYEITLPLVGEFQVKNALAALGLVLSKKRAHQDEYVTALEGLSGAPGRLELVNGHHDGAAIYVDYAHTPAALDNVLSALRPHTAGKLVCVFGCGGERDRGKRSVMGEIAARLADSVIVTDDNPRGEDPAAIRAKILKGAQLLEGAKSAQEIADRAAAIQSAIKSLATGDVLVIAGKGHETGQVYGGQTLPFDDGEVAREIIKSLGIKGT